MKFIYFSDQTNKYQKCCVLGITCIENINHSPFTENSRQYLLKHNTILNLASSFLACWSTKYIEE